MKRAAETNINTVAYWAAVYSAEQAGDRHRVDALRGAQLDRWVRVREGELQRAAVVLDVGCGLGDALCALRTSRPDRQLVGADISDPAVKCLREAHNLEAHLIANASDVGAMDAMQNRFDVAWCGETLEHLDTPDAAIDALAKCINGQGFLVLSTPFKGRNRSPEHVWEFDPTDIQRWADRVGELVFLDCCLLPGWLTMFAVIRIGGAT